mmetsp:Transcript_17538/g.43761  ORF Transcript_17538/g.43761 Transcript_17538/m.43761 type:complete len:248 (-) Transcript_17538:1536-2279(-)
MSMPCCSTRGARDHLSEILLSGMEPTRPHWIITCSRPSMFSRPISKRTWRAVVSMPGRKLSSVSHVSSSKSRLSSTGPCEPQPLLRSSKGWASSVRMSGSVACSARVPSSRCRWSAYSSRSSCDMVHVPLSLIAAKTASSSASSVSAASSSSSSCIASKHILRAKRYDSGCTRQPSRPGACLRPPGTSGGRNLMKPTALHQTLGPRKDRSCSRVSGADLVADCAITSRSSLAALRGPRPGTNWSILP